MAVDIDKLRIVHYPDPILRQKTPPISDVTDEVRAVAVRMLELMHEAPGVGLAAPQVGLPWRMFVANAHPEHDRSEDKVFINPVLRDAGRELEDYEEGCLSLPDILAEVRRPKQITIDALDIDGKPFTMTSDTLWARVWQHEFDHLEGVLIIDRMTPLDRTANRRALRELEQEASTTGRR